MAPAVPLLVSPKQIPLYGRPLSNLPRLNSSGRPRKVGVPKFLRYLYQMLSQEDSSIITWAHNGTSFQILDINAMAKVILPKYFRHSKYASFQRQLNYFGFRKWTKTQTDICTFSHPHFTKGNPNDLRLIRRKNHPENPGSRKRLFEESTALSISSRRLDLAIIQPNTFDISTSNTSSPSQSLIIPPTIAPKNMKVSSITCPPDQIDIESTSEETDDSSNTYDIQLIEDDEILVETFGDVDKLWVDSLISIESTNDVVIKEETTHKLSNFENDDFFHYLAFENDQNPSTW